LAGFGAAAADPSFVALAAWPVPAEELDDRCWDWAWPWRARRGRDAEPLGDAEAAGRRGTRLTDADAARAHWRTHCVLTPEHRSTWRKPELRGGAGTSPTTCWAAYRAPTP